MPEFGDISPKLTQEGAPKVTPEGASGVAREVSREAGEAASPKVERQDSEAVFWGKQATYVGTAIGAVAAAVVGGPVGVVSGAVFAIGAGATGLGIGAFIDFLKRRDSPDIYDKHAVGEPHNRIAQEQYNDRNAQGTDRPR